MSFSLPLVLGASIAVGLPLTWLLRHIGRETRVVYGTAGLLLGGVLMAYLLVDLNNGISNQALFACIAGMIGGGAAGLIWGQERAKLFGLNSD